MFCARLFICALWSPAGKGLTSWLSFVVSSVSLSLSHWYPESGVVLDCIDSWSLHLTYFYFEFFSGGSSCYTRNFLPKRENFHVQLQDIVVDQQPVHFADTASFLEKLKKANKSAVIFSVTDPKPQPKLSGPSLPQSAYKCLKIWLFLTLFFMNNLSMKFEMLIKLKCWKYMFCFQTLRHCLYHVYSC